MTEITRFTPRQQGNLEKRLDPANVKTRRGTGNQPDLSYVAGFYVIGKANAIFGFDGWSTQVMETVCVSQPLPGEFNYEGRENRKGYFIAYTERVKVTIHFEGQDYAHQEHEDVGYGEDINYSNPGQGHEKAIKEAVTDATKRALRHWGDQFGLELYDKEREPADAVDEDGPTGYVERAKAPAQEPVSESPRESALLVKASVVEGRSASEAATTRAAAEPRRKTTIPQRIALLWPTAKTNLKYTDEMEENAKQMCGVKDWADIKTHEQVDIAWRTLEAGKPPPESTEAREAVAGGA